jgi:stage II sporulation protein D
VARAANGVGVGAERAAGLFVGGAAPWRWAVRRVRGGAVVALVATACARPVPGPQPTGREPDVRIGLAVGVSAVSVGSDGRTVASQRDAAAFRLPPGATVSVRADGLGIVVDGGPGAGRYERLSFVALDEARFVTVDGRAYRGIVEVFAAAGGITAVNVVPLEAYLAGVVNAEMGRRTAAERAALESQAVVARTYALRNQGKAAANGFDLRAGVADQAYGGVASETAEGREAVRATRGQVLVYGGELIVPFYHSTCGGSTAAPEEAFRTVRSTAYLAPVSDRRGDGYYCDISPRFQWNVEWDGPTLRRILRQTVPATIGVDEAIVDEIRDVRQRRSGPSGRAAELRLAVSSGEIPVFGPDVRSVLQTPDGRALGSTLVRLTVEYRDGVVDRLRADGRGWGHGVGMCQWGAVGRARAGQSARTILETYFPGAHLAHWY